jgi:hypothetical protein
MVFPKSHSDPSKSSAKNRFESNNSFEILDDCFEDNFGFLPKQGELYEADLNITPARPVDSAGQKGGLA